METAPTVFPTASETQLIAKHLPIGRRPLLQIKSRWRELDYRDCTYFYGYLLLVFRAIVKYFYVR